MPCKSANKTFVGPFSVIDSTRIAVMIDPLCDRSLSHLVTVIFLLGSRHQHRPSSKEPVRHTLAMEVAAEISV